MTRVTLTTRQIGGGVVVACGVLSLLSGLWINPVVGRLIKGPAVVDFADVLAGYFWCSVIVGLCLIAVGRRVMRDRSHLDNFALLVLILGGLVLCDRYLLTRFGLPLWIYDAEIGYRNRPNVVRTSHIGGTDGYVHINQWGFVGPAPGLKKPAKDLRVLLIGDSVTMGYGVNYAGTFGAQLEALLNAHDHKFARHEVINTGVFGYSTFQEKVTLERTMKFSPDIVFVGFCMNDVTEPFVVDKTLGGTGLDYHGVTQTSNAIVGWFANETGFGRLEQALITRGKSLEAAKRLEIYNVRDMAVESRTSPRMREAWAIVLGQMGELYDIAARHGIPVVLVIFPYTFQLADAGLRTPQQILAEQAAQHGVPVIDTTGDFAHAVFDDPRLIEFLRHEGKSPADILNYHLYKVQRFFFDEDHFTAAGNKIVADRLFKYLERVGMVGDVPISLPADRGGSREGGDEKR